MLYQHALSNIFISSITKPTYTRHSQYDQTSLSKCRWRLWTFIFCLI